MAFGKLRKVPGKKGIQFLVIRKHKNSIEINVKYFLITDGKFKVVFVPALNLSGYGKTAEEAHSMLEEAMDDYFGRIIKFKQDVLIHELSKFGWKLVSASKRFENRAYINKEGILRDFKLPEGTPIEERMVSLAA